MAEKDQESLTDKAKAFIGKINGPSPPGKKPNKQLYLVAAVLLGIVLMVAGNLFAKPKMESKPASLMVEEAGSVQEEEAFSQKAEPKSKDMKAMEERYEEKLRLLLNEIAGVQNVSVFVNVESTERKVYEKNRSHKNQMTNEEDQEGGKRSIEEQTVDEQLVTIRDGNDDKPVLLETRKPEISGVLVVAGGAEKIQVKKWIIEAVTRSLDVPSHKVAVMPKKSKGDS